MREKALSTNEDVPALLFICDHSMQAVGGSQESLKIIIETIENLYHISLFTPGQAEYNCQNLKHYHFSRYDSMKKLIRHPASFFLYYCNLLKVIRKNKYKVIHTQEQIGYFAVSFFKRLRLIKREIVLIHTERGLREKYGSFINALFDFSLKYTDVLITTTEYNRRAWQEVIDRKCCGSVSCVLIENTAGALFDAFEQEKHKSSKMLRVGFAGRYCGWKGWDLAEEICTLAAENPHIEIHMVLGCADQKEEEKAAELFDRMKALYRSRFMGDINRTIAGMNDFYYDLDIFVLTSKPHTESFGRVLIEAMSRRVVVLGTDCGGAVEVIGDQNHILNNAQEFAKKIDFYERGRDVLEREKEEAYLRYKENYSLANNQKKHLQLYSQYMN